MKIDAGSFKRANTKNDNSFTVGCGAATTTLVIADDLGLGPCDMMIETEKTPPIKSPAEILMIWRTHELFQKWRGNTKNKDWSDVHMHGCHALHLSNKKHDRFIPIVQI